MNDYPMHSFRRAVRRGFLLVAVCAFGTAAVLAAEYFPPAGDWQHRRPDELGVDALKLQQAIDFVRTAENPANKDQAQNLKDTFGKQEPNFKILGPTQTRAALNGLIVHRGYVVAEWGDTTRTDMTHSITKTFLTTLVGLAWQRGLIREINNRVSGYLPTKERDELFGSEHNASITWNHLLRQSSDWSGTLWGVPDWADRPVGKTTTEQQNRAMHDPGTFFKYNDVRVNLLALCALYVWRRPLPEVLREEIMVPIGASSTWRWNGYENSWIDLDGRRVQSVSGGGHFGGGMFIDARDLARFGYLFLREGKWGDRQLVSKEWIAMARTPGPANDTYGFANWYLNTGRKPLPATPASSVTFRGAGTNIVYIDWENDLVVVVRWIKDDVSLNAFLGQVIAALTKTP